MYGVGLYGWEDYSCNCDFCEILELVSCGAKLNIHDPNEFIFTEEDENEE